MFTVIVLTVLLTTNCTSAPDMRQNVCVLSMKTTAQQSNAVNNSPVTSAARFVKVLILQKSPLARCCHPPTQKFRPWSSP